MRNYQGLNNMIIKQLILFLNFCAPYMLGALDNRLSRHGLATGLLAIQWDGALVQSVSQI